MTHPRRRFFWHAAAGFWVGFACTFFLAPISPTGTSTSTALALLVCTPVVSMIVGLAAALFARSTVLALAGTLVLAVLFGVVNDLAIHVVARALDGAEIARDLQMHLGTYLAYLSGSRGALVALACVLPLCAATWAARTASQRPTGTRGAARNVILVAGATASLGVPFARIGLGGTPWWPVITIGCALGALACIVQASRDLGIAVFLGKLLRQEDPHLAVARAETKGPPLAGVDLVSCLSDRPSGGHVVVRQVRHYEGPCRISQETTPVLQIGAEPVVVRRSLLLGALVLLLLAGAQGAMAVGSAGIVLPQ